MVRGQNDNSSTCNLCYMQESNDTKTCEATGVANLDVFIVRHSPRLVETIDPETKERGTKRVTTNDVWRIWLQASGKGKDNDFVTHHYCLLHIIKYYKDLFASKTLTLQLVRLWTDGAPGQYKLRQNFLMIARLPQTKIGDPVFKNTTTGQIKFHGVQVVHNFAATGQFKGIHDQAGKNTKHWIRKGERTQVCEWLNDDQVNNPDTD